MWPPVPGPWRRRGTRPSGCGSRTGTFGCCWRPSGRRGPGAAAPSTAPRHSPAGSTGRARHRTDPGGLAAGNSRGVGAPRPPPAPPGPPGGPRLGAGAAAAAGGGGGREGGDRSAAPLPAVGAVRGGAGGSAAAALPERPRDVGHPRAVGHPQAVGHAGAVGRPTARGQPRVGGYPRAVGQPRPPALSGCSPAVERRLRGLALVRGGFLSPGEAAELLRELEPVLGRRPYQFDHWDGAICGYRETERARWGGAGRAVLARLGGAFPPGRPAQPLVHVLDLHPGGHVRPHLDSVKFCGCTIAGVSLLTPSVMRLVSCRPGGGWLELLLEPGSLYVLRGAARYEFTHEILPDHASFFGGRRVPRGRRVALICRNAPQDTTPDTPGDSPAFIGDTETEPPPANKH
ncbi:alpha-ketoglutarate-dependent dioxygenase alkB homolog 7, mitochondrial isoform X2 [Balearica regulorum gibbericeps]|uniref:alpha-ketoglutarate-dependent dioxygenase alkB homolog 7, mitochondrial isoform X2 n=1 Tax=Balearica regulorum gibbericeps TaxID=100784 RepID=UPI003F5D80A8